jgi:hypothetical protein
MEKRKSAPALVDSKLISCLRTDSKVFIEALGEPQLEGRGFSFPAQNLPFHHFTIGYDLDKKFLGKIYLMTLEGILTGGAPVLPSRSLELRYSGFIRKGRPFFALRGQAELKGTEKGLISLFHRDQILLEECRKLEIEFLKILFDPREGSCKIQVRPYGGSLIKIVMPPLNYHVRLISEQAVLILAVMKRIAGIIKDFNR